MHRILRNVEVSEGHAQGARYGEHAAVVAGKLNGLPLAPEELERRQMQRIQGSRGHGKASRARARTVGDSSSSATRPTSSRAASPCEWARSRACSRVQISYSSNRLATRVSLQSEAGGRRSSADRCQRHGRIEVDQRALLSSPSSASNSCNGATAGGVGGGTDEVRTGGVSQPFRTASASSASASKGLLVACGGPSSATIRSRSVIRTVSPGAATRTYSLSLLFRTFMPADLMERRVATRCHLVKVVMVGLRSRKPTG